MILISHRGNINCKKEELENSPQYVLRSIRQEYNVEIDIWKIEDKWFLGHDEPKYEIDFYDFIYSNHNLWLHCKNLESLKDLTNKKNFLNINWLKYFWHQNDDFTLTSNNIIWTYPGKELTKNSICVLPELSNYTEDELKNCYGICSDYIEKFKTLIQ